MSFWFILGLIGAGLLVGLGFLVGYLRSIDLKLHDIRRYFTQIWGLMSHFRSDRVEGPLEEGSYDQKEYEDEEKRVE